MLPIPLSQLLPGQSAVIQSVQHINTHDMIAQRLNDLGFVSGELVHVTAVTPFKLGPLVIKIGMARFALRQSEAARILVKETL